MKIYDAVIIGGGFYGLRLAQFLCEELQARHVLVLEAAPEVMTRASRNNQARVHNGYHYPRSVLTALRSSVNLPVFSREYEAAIVSDFNKYYAVAAQYSKVSGRQFRRFFERLGIDIEPAPEARHYFNPKYVEAVFKVKEYAFNVDALKRQLLDRLSHLNVSVVTGEPAIRVSQAGDRLQVETFTGRYQARFVINTTYSAINTINAASSLPLIPLKHELTEMCLVDVPEQFCSAAFTVMCGPFFSLMPYPSTSQYTLSHVRYTPHSEWHDLDTANSRDNTTYLNLPKPASNFPKMIADVKRFMPDGARIEYSGTSLWEVKTVLPQSEDDDSRPILYKAHYGGLQNYICIMGGKIDNIYDVFRELKETYAQSQ